MDRKRVARICTTSSLGLASCLALSVPFGPSRNTDMQGLLLIIIGGLATLALAIRRDIRLKLWQLISLGLFAGSTLLSTLVNPHYGYDLLGAPYIRLGCLGLLSCIAFGLLVSHVRPAKLSRTLYIGIVCGALLSIVYSLYRFHSLWRFGGVFSQADIMACFLGCGLLLGWEQLRKKTNVGWLYHAGVQLFLLSLLVLTQTRAVLFLVVVLSIVWALRNLSGKTFYCAIAALGVSLALFVSLHTVLPARLTDKGYASESIHYRLDLQSTAVQTSTHKPLLGYGPGNLADALDCRKIHASSLLKTCHDRFFFNSSHNIFLDRVLAIGWLGGIAYTSFVVICLARGLKHSSKVAGLDYVALLISGYYLTNVTSVALELFFWAALWQLARANRA